MRGLGLGLGRSKLHSSTRQGRRSRVSCRARSVGWHLSPLLQPPSCPLTDSKFPILGRLPVAPAHFCLQYVSPLLSTVDTHYASEKRITPHGPPTHTHTQSPELSPAGGNAWRASRAGWSGAGTDTWAPRTGRWAQVPGNTHALPLHSCYISPGS
jgi:hypothetical protein